MARLIISFVATLLITGCSAAGPTSAPTDQHSSAPPSVTSTPTSTASEEGMPSEPPGTSVPSPEPSRRGESPAPGPSAKPTVPARVDLDVGSHATVVTDNLRLRSVPSLGTDSTFYHPLLQPGTGLWILGGPTAGSGYDWYQVALDRTVADAYPGLGEGWVAAAAHDGTPWLAAQAFADTAPAGARVWTSEPGDLGTGTASFDLPEGVHHLIFSGAPSCVYRVRFGASLEFDMGFEGAVLSSVLWPNELPEPSMATSGPGTSITSMPELPAGTYLLQVSDHGAPYLQDRTPGHPCPWGVVISRA